MKVEPKPEKYYKAQITLGFTPSDGDLIGGTINGVEVNGQWIGAKGQAILYRGGNADAYKADYTNVPFCMIGFRNEKAVISFKQDSAPTTDYELHLYRYVPSGIVQIPPEYVEGLEETTANASEALNTANTAESAAGIAQNMAESAKSTANTAKTTAERAKTTAERAKSTAEIAKSTAESAKSTAESAKSTANTAKTTAETAQSTANAAKTTAEKAIRSIDGYYYRLSSTSETNQYPRLVLDDLHQNSSIAIYATPTNSLNIMLNRDGGSLSGDPFGPATIKLVPNAVADDNIIVDGVKAFIMPSSTSGSTKKFKLTVDDTGTISATEVT